MNELERYKKALEVALLGVSKMSNYSQSHHSVRDGIESEINDEIQAILQPPPVYEEVELTRWECDKCHNITYNDTPPDKCIVCQGQSFTLLTGTRRVEKPQQRERSVSVEAKLYGSGGAVEETLTDAVFGQFKEAHGKRGVLTFTWQE